MHARVGLYKVKPDTLDASLTKARNELLPKMREQPGIKRYTVVRTGPDSFISLSGWETRSQAEQAAETLSGWVKENMGQTVISAENHIGEVLIMHGQTALDKTSKYAMVRVSTRKPDAPDMTERMRTDDGTRIGYIGWDSKAAQEKAQPEISRWGDANVAPHMSKVEVHEGEVAWAVRKA